MATNERFVCRYRKAAQSLTTSTLMKTDPLVLKKVDPAVARANSRKPKHGFAWTCATR